jgi:hypothetical protein
MLFNICDDYYEPTKYVLNNNKEDDNGEKVVEELTQNNIKDENDFNECFICYENSFDKIIKLNHQCFYFKKCKCDGYIHKKCLDTWFDTTSKCPICRSFINKNTNIESKIIHLNYYLFIIYILCKKNFFKIIRFLIVIIFFYYTSQQYINIFKYKILYKNYFKNEYNYHNYNCLIASTDINVGINYIIPFNNVIIHPKCFD